jgi:hypothetical protein
MGQFPFILISFIMLLLDFQVSEELVKRREYLLLRKEAKAYNKMIYGTEEYVYTTLQTSTNLNPICFFSF